ncbi:MAG: hypothetical protein LBJ31_02970 [Treponema sp.]|nr:hypothetical protein [Treponema sp.]
MNIKSIRKIIPVTAAALYPLLIFCGLVIFKIPLRIVSLAVLGCGVVFFISVTGAKKKSPRFTPCCLPPPARLPL